MVVNITVLPGEMQSEIEQKVEEFANLDESDGSMKDYVYEEKSEGIEVRIFPTGDIEGTDFYSYPVEGINMEVWIHDGLSWHEELGVYSADNLRNGNDVYVALAEELEKAVRRAGFDTPNFIIEKSGMAFTETIEL